MSLDDVCWSGVVRAVTMSNSLLSSVMVSILPSRLSKIDEDCFASIVVCTDSFLLLKFKLVLVGRFDFSGPGACLCLLFETVL